jgi:hypothetical protein
LTRKFNEGTLSKSNVLSTIKFLKRKYLKWSCILDLRLCAKPLKQMGT